MRELDKEWILCDKVAVAISLGNQSEDFNKVWGVDWFGEIVMGEFEQMGSGESIEFIKDSLVTSHITSKVT